MFEPNAGAVGLHGLVLRRLGKVQKLQPGNSEPKLQYPITAVFPPQNLRSFVEILETVLCVPDDRSNPRLWRAADRIGIRCRSR